MSDSHLELQIQSLLNRIEAMQAGVPPEEPQEIADEKDLRAFVLRLAGRVADLENRIDWVEPEQGNINARLSLMSEEAEN